MTTVTTHMSNVFAYLEELHLARIASMEQACKIVHLLGYDITEECRIYTLDWDADGCARQQLHVCDVLVFEVLTQKRMVGELAMQFTVTPRLIAWPEPRWEGQQHAGT